MDEELDMAGKIKQLDGKLLTSQDVARILGLSPARIRQLEETGELPAARTLGGNRIFCLSDVEKYEKKRKRKERK